MIKNKYCLILNSYYEPIRIVGFKTAIKTIYSKDNVKILEEFDEVIRSPSISLRLPSVIQIQTKESVYKREFKVFRPSKYNVYHRDEGKCSYCTKKLTYQEATLDHIVPKSKNGKTEYSNLTLACNNCNTQKSNKDPNNFKPLVNKHGRPQYQIEKKIGIKVHGFHWPDSWLKYINL